MSSRPSSFTASEPPTARKTHWCTSFKLWLVLLLIALAAIAAAVCIPTSRRMQAISYLEEHHTDVTFSADSEWLTKWLGTFGTALRPVETIVCSTINDEVLLHIAELSEVRELFFVSYNTQPLTVSSTRALGCLRRLEVLQIDGKLVMADDQDLFIELFATNPPLRGVAIPQTPMTAAALRELTTIQSLLSLSAYTHEDISDLRPLPNLQECGLRFECEIDLSWLRASPKLWALSFNGPLDEEDLQLIGELTSLTQLSIIPSEFGGSITDAGIEHLSQLKDLQRIRLPADVITPDTVELLRRLSHLEFVDMFGPVPVRGPLRESMREHWQVNQYLNGY